MLTDNLFGWIALDAGRPCIPTRHTAVAVQHVNGVVFDSVQEHAEHFFACAQLRVGFGALRSLGFERRRPLRHAPFQIAVN